MPMVLALCSLTVAAADPALLTLTVKDSLEASVLRVMPGHDGSALAQEIARLLRWKGDIKRELHRGDNLEVLYEQSDTDIELVAMHYQGLQISLQAYRFKGADGIDRYYDEKSNLIEPQMLNPPVPTYEQICELVQKRSRGQRGHKGIDLKAPEGAPVRLPFAGTVSRVNWMRRVNGNCIEIAFDDGHVGHFLHLQHVDAAVKPGAHLNAGTPLGAVGTTGHSNGPHLHYEILTDGNPVEPLDIHGRRHVKLDGASLTAFNNVRNAFDRQLQGPPAAVPLETLLSTSCLTQPPYVQEPLCRQTQALR